MSKNNSPFSTYYNKNLVGLIKDFLANSSLYEIFFDLNLKDVLDSPLEKYLLLIFTHMFTIL